MSAGKMHVDEVDVGVSLVGRLLAAQFPLHSGFSWSRKSFLGTSLSLFLGFLRKVRGNLFKIHT